MDRQKNCGEWIEVEALRAIHEVAPDSVKQSLGLQFIEVDGVLCSASAQEPSILINRCFGLGQQQMATLPAIKAVKQFYRDAGVGEFFLHLVPDAKPDNIHELLQQAGMRKDRGWMKFARELSQPIASDSGHIVKKIGPEYALSFARIVAPCFDMSDEAVPLLSSLVGHPHWHVYMGFDGGRPAATGALFVKEGVAYCDWGSTHQDYRRRGFQGALLAHRINEAIAMGCQQVFTATGEAVPDDPQHSYKNILRYGFEEKYLRENWSPE